MQFMQPQPFFNNGTGAGVENIRGIESELS